MSNLYGRGITHDDAEAWVRNGLRNLKSRGVLIIDDSQLKDQSADRAQLIVSLTQGCIQAISTSKSAVVVVHGQVLKNNEVVSDRNYRGRDTGMNWASAQSEMQSALNQAMTEALSKLADDLKKHCL